MSALIVGLAIFLATHSIRIVADQWRTEQIARIGAMRWRGLYSLVSLLGLVLIVWGYGQTRAVPIDLWYPPGWTRYLTTALSLPAFVLLLAAYVPGNCIKARLGHPFLVGVKTWAFAHLLSNGRLGDVLLFGAFFLWAVFDYVSMRRRDRAAAIIYPQGTLARDAITGALGFFAWAFFVVILHKWLIGVAPLG
jgi:uncharacterized membrane protein